MEKAKKTRSPFDQRRYGYAGKFGSGANIDMMYLQTAFSPAQVVNISLIEEIPGSERWDIRDLFQRHVNKKRVSNLKDYLLNESSVKFFNPITLILLPYDQHTHRVVSEVQHLEPKSVKGEDLDHTVYENDGHYQLKFYEAPEQSELHWSQEKTRLVAIDGQHRLSAIKQIQKDARLSAKMGTNWSVPAVILVMSKSVDADEAPNLLEVVRKTFININQEAAQINASRLIILDDESVNRICCQEIVNAAHQNDQKDSESDIDQARTPLMFFDWRGEVEGNKEKPVEGSILKLVELEGLFENFLLGEDGSSEQRIALGIDDMVPEVESCGKSEKLTSRDANRIRSQFKSHMMPAIQNLLENIKPFNEYISEVRRLQFPANYSELANKAFKQICFGSAPVMNPSEYEDVNLKVREMVQDFTIAKHNIDPLLQRDIGLRAIVSPFSQLKSVYDDEVGKTTSWESYSNWFIPKVNNLIDEGWFKEFSDDTRSDLIQKFTLYTVFQPNGQIDNYKFKDVADAFGAVIGLQVSRGESQEFRESYWEIVENRLRRVLLKGYKAKIRSDLQSEPMTNTERTREVNVKATIETDARLSSFRENYFSP